MKNQDSSAQTGIDRGALMRKVAYLFSLVVLCIFLWIYYGIHSDQESKAWEYRLYTPTFITKFDDDYFIVDCWHHRIIYSDSLEKNIEDWIVLTSNVAGPHSIAYDGEIYIYEDTGRHSLIISKKKNGKIIKTQTIKNSGLRPHRIIYDKITRSFFAIAANSQEIIKIKNDNGKAKVVYKKKLEFLSGSYTRSISIIDGSMFFVSGPEKIIQTTYKNGVFNILKEFSVPKGFYSMNDIYKSKNGWYYFTATPKKIARSKSIMDFSKGKFQDLFTELGVKGTPYYITEMDNKIFLPQITEHSGILTFEEKSNEIINISPLMDYGPSNQSDKLREKLYPK